MDLRLNYLKNVEYLTNIQSKKYLIKFLLPYLFNIFKVDDYNEQIKIIKRIIEYESIKR
jgi:hypothetical protein